MLPRHIFGWLTPMRIDKMLERINGLLVNSIQISGICLKANPSQDITNLIVLIIFSPWLHRLIYFHSTTITRLGQRRYTAVYPHFLIHTKMLYYFPFRFYLINNEIYKSAIICTRIATFMLMLLMRVLSHNSIISWLLITPDIQNTPITTIKCLVEIWWVFRIRLYWSHSSDAAAIHHWIHTEQCDRIRVQFHFITMY